MENYIDLTSIKTVMSTMGPNMQANNNASICKAVPNKIQGLHTTLNSCRSEQEDSRILDMIRKTTQTTDKFKHHEMIYNDLVATGDRLFGSMSSHTMIQDIANRNEELKKTKVQLEREISNNEGISEVENRDFIDELNENPEPQKTYRLNVVEDYTLSVFSITYLFMALSFGFLYIRKNNYSITSIIYSIISIAIATVVMFLLLNFLI